MKDSIQAIEERADLIAAAISNINKQIEAIKGTGVVAPPGCCVMRYQATGSGRTYWYYKLHASEPIFTTKNGKRTKYKHLGKGGSPAHIEALMQVTRRTQIEALQRTLYGLEQSWSDLYDQNNRLSSKS